MVVVALTLLVGTVAATGPVESPRQLANETGDNATDGPATANTTLQFDNQTLLDSNVTVASVNLSDGGFVAIYNETGGILAASEYLEPGPQTNVTVTLPTPLPLGDEEGNLTANVSDGQATDGNRTVTLVALAHRDTNGNQTFDFVTTNGTEDLPYVAVDDALVTIPQNDTTGGQDNVTTDGETAGQGSPAE